MGNDCGCAAVPAMMRNSFGQQSACRYKNKAAAPAIISIKIWQELRKKDLGAVAVVPVINESSTKEAASSSTVLVVAVGFSKEKGFFGQEYCH